MQAIERFDYDLWTTNENGKTRYWAKVKRTKQVTEISKEVMLYLHSEEMRICRNMQKVTQNGGDLSLDALMENENSPLQFDDARDYAEDVMTAMMEDAFIKGLTPRQKDFYLSCIKGGMGVREYARSNHLAYMTVVHLLEVIRKKIKFYI